MTHEIVFPHAWVDDGANKMAGGGDHVRQQRKELDYPEQAWGSRPAIDLATHCVH